MLKKLILAAGVAIIGTIIAAVVKKREDGYETVSDTADDMTQTACETMTDILKEGCSLGVKDKFEKAIEHVKTVGKMTFGYGIQSNDILKMSKQINPEVHDEFFEKQLRYEKLAKNVGAGCMIACGLILVGCTTIRMAIYEHALTNQDEYLLIHRANR